ncbi:MAG: DUF6172 family protein [Opitutales bacterium]
MKKTFPLTDAKHKPERQLEAVKGEISKYLKRERRKPLPEEVDFWDFDCRCGTSEESAEAVHVKALPQRMEALQTEGASECYVEILAKPGKRAVEQPNNPLHGYTLEQIVESLSDYYGWESLGEQIPIRCFQMDPSVKSSLKFLRQTPWARQKVEELFLYTLKTYGE